MRRFWRMQLRLRPSIRLRFIGIVSLLWLAGLPLAALAGEDPARTEEATLAQQTVQAGPVTLKVAPRLSDTSLTLEVTLDTHLADLDQYDLSQLAVVRTDEGREIQPEAWEAPKGGHHREGTLTFPRFGEDGSVLIAPEIRALQLVVRDIGGVSETVIEWSLVA